MLHLEVLFKPRVVPGQISAILALEAAVTQMPPDVALEGAHALKSLSTLETLEEVGIDERFDGPLLLRGVGAVLRRGGPHVGLVAQQVDANVALQRAEVLVPLVAVETSHLALVHHQLKCVLVLIIHLGSSPWLLSRRTVQISPDLLGLLSRGLLSLRLLHLISRGYVLMVQLRLSDQDISARGWFRAFPGPIATGRGQ